MMTNNTMTSGGNRLISGENAASAEGSDDMWMALIDFFRGGDEVDTLGSDFRKMLEITREMAAIVRPHVFDHSLDLEARRHVYKLDIEVNKLERSIRKRIVTHLSLQPNQVPYCLLLMTLVKDAERIGDYVKNVSEVGELGGKAVPAGPLRDELESLIELATELHEAAPVVVLEQDRERATELIQAGRAAGKRCDRLLVELSRTDLGAAQTTSMVLLTRFYKRIGAHLVNVLSSVVMPVHKVDFFDERTMSDASANADV